MLDWEFGYDRIGRLAWQWFLLYFCCAGKSTTHLIVYAQLYTPNGEHHGLNAFLVQVRDRKTHLPLPGVIVGDLGEKIGLNGLDNGFVMFNHCRISRDSLLGKTGVVSDDGKFETKIKDKKKRIGASFGALSGGRVNICAISNTYLTKAISIAVRYSASRKQFGDANDADEWPVLEYQSQQYRVLPQLATCIVQKVFTLWLVRTYTDIARRSFFEGESVIGPSMEMHAISSAVKPVCTWAARDGIQECREACGGHGYLKGWCWFLSYSFIHLEIELFFLRHLQLLVSAICATITTRIWRTKAKITYCCNSRAIGCWPCVRVAMISSNRSHHWDRLHFWANSMRLYVANSIMPPPMKR